MHPNTVVSTMKSNTFAEMRQGVQMKIRLLEQAGCLVSSIPLDTLERHILKLMFSVLTEPYFNRLFMSEGGEAEEPLNSMMSSAYLAYIDFMEAEIVEVLREEIVYPEEQLIPFKDGIVYGSDYLPFEARETYLLLLKEELRLRGAAAQIVRFSKSTAPMLLVEQGDPRYRVIVDSGFFSAIAIHKRWSSRVDGSTLIQDSAGVKDEHDFQNLPHQSEMAEEVIKYLSGI